MKISIIIATYNAGKTLRNCLESIIPQLENDNELIIIDGASKDDTVKILKEHASHLAYWISEPDKGIYDAWNKGILKARGEWIMFLGADDILKKNAVNKYITFLSKYKNENIDFISCKIKSTTKDGLFIQNAGKLWNYARCRINMDVIHAASLTNKSYFDKIGFFNIDYKICGDYEFLLRGKKEMKAAFIDEILAVMPIGGISYSIKGLKEQLKIKHKIARIHILQCYLIFIFQVFLFYTYKLRH